MCDRANKERDGEALTFFGRVAANLSHEMANAVGTLSQATGLLDDLLCGFEAGNPVDIERLRVIQQRLERQATRATGLIQELNFFAHTVDSREEEVDLNFVARNLVAVSRRPAAMRGVDLEFEPESASVLWSGDAYSLLEVLFLALGCFCENLDRGGKVEVRVAKAPTGIEIRTADCLVEEIDCISLVQSQSARIGGKASLEYRPEGAVMLLTLATGRAR
jgi:signal transduction histidine kinase